MFIKINNFIVNTDRIDYISKQNYDDTSSPPTYFVVFNFGENNLHIPFKNEDARDTVFDMFTDLDEAARQLKND